MEPLPEKGREMLPAALTDPRGPYIIRPLPKPKPLDQYGTNRAARRRASQAQARCDRRARKKAARA